MTLTIRYFASLREAIGLEREVLELPADLLTVADLRAYLCRRGEPWASALAEGKAVRAAIAQRMCAADAALEDGAELAFFPPVTGG